MKYPVHFSCFRCSVCTNADIICSCKLCSRGGAMLHLPWQLFLLLLSRASTYSISYIYICEVPQAKCVTLYGRIQAQCISVEINNDSIARKLCSLFSTLVLYFGPMKVGEEKSHFRELRTLGDVLGCFSSLNMRASFYSFHSSCFINLLLSFQDLRRDHRRVTEVGRDHRKSLAGTSIICYRKLSPATSRSLEPCSCPFRSLTSL